MLDQFFERPAGPALSPCVVHQPSEVVVGKDDGLETERELVEVQGGAKVALVDRNACGLGQHQFFMSLKLASSSGLVVTAL